MGGKGIVALPLFCYKQSESSFHYEFLVCGGYKLLYGTSFEDNDEVVRLSLDLGFTMND